MRVRALQILTVLIVGMMALDALFTPVILLWASFSPGSYAQLVAPVSTTVDQSAFILRILTMILFCRWIYVAGTNLIAMGYEGLEFSPASRIWWFAVPFACLVKPFQGMRELWNASHGELQYDRDRPQIALWWALWLGAGFFTTFLSFAMKSGPADLILWWIDSVLGIAVAMSATVVVWGIAQAQQRPGTKDMAEVFA